MVHVNIIRHHNKKKKKRDKRDKERKKITLGIHAMMMPNTCKFLINQLFEYCGTYVLTPNFFNRTRTKTLKQFVP